MDFRVDAELTRIFQIIGKGNEYITLDDLRRVMKEFNSNDLDGIALELVNDLLNGSSLNGRVHLRQWLAFFQRISSDHGFLHEDDLKELRVVVGEWPLSEDARKELKRLFFSVQAQNGSKSDAPTDRHLVKAVEAIVKSEEEADDLVGSVLFEFMPHYTENQVLSISEWMGFWARFGMKNSYPTPDQLSEITRAVRRVRPPLEASMAVKYDSGLA